MVSDLSFTASLIIFRKTSEMKAAEDAAADAEVLKGYWRRVAFLLLLQSKVHPLMYLNQQLQPSLLLVSIVQTWKKLKKKVNLMDLKPVMKVKSKENKEDSGHESSVGDKDKSDSSDANILKGGDISKEKHTEDQTNIVMTSPPVSPPCTTSKPGTVDTLDIAMISPKGSSRSEGGILRGNAFGNHLNAANFSSAVESTTQKQTFLCKAWNLLGSFETAVMEDEEIDWLKIDGEIILPVLSSGFKPNATPPSWYDNYSNFDKIANFPAMQAWLAGDEESPTDLDLWGFESDHYTFLDLKKWLKEKVEKRKGKGKGKSKEEKGDKDEGTSERKEKSK
ncbi:hypothetical protein BDQ17DRAFT_1321712 [Cyathus striatus]|nr:hypothetical protein BDQ17DRAFT_1321712 [Cyathus striatus]